MPGSKHGKVCYRIATAIGQFVDSNDLGHMFINDTFVKIPTKYDPERVYGADVCFVSYDRLPKDAEIPYGLVPVTPNLVVEVRSPSDTWTQVFGKIADYLGRCSGRRTHRPEVPGARFRLRRCDRTAACWGSTMC